MNRSAFAVPVLVLLVSLVVWGALPRSGDERRIQGTVLDAQATYCEPRKSDGCTGSVRLDRAEGGARETLEIKVPLGTPISAGCEALSLGELPGRRVVVTEVEQGRSRVALAISAADAPPAGPC